MPNYDAWGRAGAPTNQELERLRSAEAVRAAEATEHYERIKRLRQFVHDQWMRIPPVVKAQPGSYDRGYQNGMADILRGLEEILYKIPTEGKSG